MGDQKKNEWRFIKDYGTLWNETLEHYTFSMQLYHTHKESIPTCSTVQCYKLVLILFERLHFEKEFSQQNVPDKLVHEWLTILCKFCWAQKCVYVNRLFCSATKCSSRAGRGRDVSTGVPRAAWQLEVGTRFQPCSIFALVDKQFMHSVPQCCSPCFHQSSKREAEQFLVVCFITSWNKSILSYVHICHMAFIQGVPGGMDKTSGECSLCWTIPT